MRPQQTTVRGNRSRAKEENPDRESLPQGSMAPRMGSMGSVAPRVADTECSMSQETPHLGALLTPLYIKTPLRQLILPQVVGSVNSL